MGHQRQLRASVCIPTYNRRALLLRTLETLGCQTEPVENYEVIVGDDGSTDGTVEALSRLKVPYRLRWVTQANAGPAAASNAAARMAEHEVIIFLDDDQLVSPELVGAHLDIQEQLGPVLIQGLFPLAPECRARGASLIYEQSLLDSLAPIDVQHNMTPDIWSANISVRRETWQAVGGLDETFREYGGEDTDFGMQVAALGIPIVFSPRALSYHVHLLDYAALRRQAFAEGRSLVRLAEKYGLAVETFSGGSTDRLPDRVLLFGWRHSRPLVHLAGGGLTAMLRGADAIRLRPLQLLLSRLIHRTYKIGGLASARRSGRATA